MKKRSAIAFSFIFLIAVIALFSSTISVNAIPYGDYNVCCIGTDVAGGTVGNCASVELASACAVGSSISNPCYGIEGRKSSEIVLNSNSLYRVTGNPLPYTCDLGCSAGQKSCYVDGTHYGCIDNSLGTYSYAGCTGSYSNPSGGYCELRVSEQYETSPYGCNYDTISTCNDDADCGWLDGTSSCSGLTQTQCSSTSGCNVQQTCSYSSSAGTYEGTGQISTCTNGICSSSQPANSESNFSAQCSLDTQDCFVCNNGYTQCSSTCKNLNTDKLNCGSCGTDCTIQYGNAAACVLGSCTAICPSGQSYVQSGTAFSSCSGTYTTGASCTGTYVVQQSKSNGGNSKYQPLALPTGGPYCYEFNQTNCLSVNGCSWTTYTSQCSNLGESACSTTTGCTSNTVPTYGCIANQCTDSDSPSIDSTSYTNYTKKGTVTGATTGVNGTDSCSGNVLTEHFCSTTNVGSTTTFNCATLGTGYTCSDGACVSPQTLTCTDTDSPSINFTSQGTVTASSGVNGTDTCITGTNILTEYYCSNLVGTSQNYQCSGNCINGACIPIVGGICGDGLIQTPNNEGINEQCDDSNTANGDGCSSTCQYEVGLYWAETDSPSSSIPSKSYNIQGTNIALVANQSQSTGTFNVYRQNYTCGAFSCTKSGSLSLGLSDGTVSDVTGDGVSDSYSIFTITGDMLASPNYDGDYEFYYIYNGDTSPTLIVHKNLGTFCGDGVVQTPNDNGFSEECDDGNTVDTDQCHNDCTLPIIDPCSEITFCGDYTDSVKCTNDATNCDVAYNSPIIGLGHCEWDAGSTPKCYKVKDDETTEGKPIGKCVSKENTKNDDCADHFLDYSWTATYTWNPANNFTTLAACKAYSTDCSADGMCSSKDGGITYQCDPKDSFSTCKSGSSIIACPAQVQLSFFDWRNVLAVVIIIFILYIVLMKSKKKIVKKVSKKKSKKK